MAAPKLTPVQYQAMVDRETVEFKAQNWQRMRSMTAHEVAVTIKALGLKRTQAARLLGISERHVRRVIRGEAELATACCLVLAALLYHGDKPLVPNRVEGWN